MTYTEPVRPMFLFDGLTVCERCVEDAQVSDLPPAEAAARCANCGYTPVEVCYEMIVTDAPEAYDGFGTRTLSLTGDGRLVGILAEHLEWQITRYRSGMYAARAL